MSSFIEAFQDNSGSCRATCNCGKDFYSADHDDWDWEEGEFEELEASESATPVDGSVGYVVIHGVQYVEKCSCWHGIANDIMRLLNGHATQIVEYIRCERARIMRKFPDVTDLQGGGQ